LVPRNDYSNFADPDVIVVTIEPSDGTRGSMSENDIIVDARGLNCPLPVLRARKALRALAPGETLTVLATDPAAVQDMAVYCAQPGKELVDSSVDDGTFSFVIRRTE
jgi:tRNA 2-thiouridine synthesizing protein A